MGQRLGYLVHVGFQKWFYPILSPWWPVLDLKKSPNALEMGSFGTISGSQWHSGCTNKWNDARFGLVLSHFGPSKVQKNP